MTRMSKKGKRRAISPRKCQAPSTLKTGPLKDNLPSGYREHANAVSSDAGQVFIGKVS